MALMAPRAIGLGATQITFVVVTALATTLGVGAVTAFTIAFTLLQIPIGVIGVPLGVVLFPSLSREVAVGNIAEFVALLTRALRAIVFVMIPVAALSAILRSESVALLFGAFTADAIELTAATLFAFTIGLVAHSLIAVLARAFYAQQDTLTPVLAAIAAVVVNTTLAVVLVDPLGLPGIALAIATAAWLEAGTLLFLLLRRVRDLDLRDTASVALRTTIATVLAAVAAVAVQARVGGALLTDPVSGGWAQIPGLLATIAAVTLAFVAVFVPLALALRITELRSIVGLVFDALRHPRRS
jgi:putative peptidoglycan lipid II flippase